MTVELCDFGARILSIKVPNKSGELVETTLNHESDDAILTDDAYMGASVGRVCNRISKAAFTLDGTKYQLSVNEGKNTLHGGQYGFAKRQWTTDGVNAQHNLLKFSLLSGDGDQGFPGDLAVDIIYSLSNLNELKFEFIATSTKATPINLCNHAYFSMGEESIHDLELTIHADAFLEVDSESIPEGEFTPVAETRFDFNGGALLSNKLAHGVYDHCYRASAKSMASLVSYRNGLRLELESDHVGVQLYTGNFLPKPQSALCLEAQGFPDAINQENLEHDILRPGDIYKRYVIYRYSTL
jgi:aldose 1-epimerase